MRVITDNPAIEKCFHKVAAIIEEHGGRVDPGLVARCAENGGISLEKHDFPNPVKPLIALPTELLLNMERARARIENDEFICDPQPGAMTPVQHKLTELMFEIYNLTGKAAAHRESCLWFSFRKAPHVLDRLMMARTPFTNQVKFLDFAKDSAARPDFNEVLCDTFFKSRTIGYKAAAAAAAAAAADVKVPEVDGDGMPPETIARLMPLIDFGNHHGNGTFFSFRTGYDKAAPEREFLLLGDSRPLAHSNECFAFYHQLDAIDSFITYGFPDMHALYVRSVPLEFEIPKLGKIIVKAMPTSPHKGKLPETVAMLRPYIPHTIGNIKDALGLTHLTIPTNAGAPQALRRVLRILISNRAAQTRTLAGAEVWDAVLQAEDHIINANVAYYKDLLSWIDSQAAAGRPDYAGPLSTVRYIAELQLTKLYKYCFDESRFQDESDAAAEAAAA